MNRMNNESKTFDLEKGGTLLGVVIGLFIGLGIALILAIFISKAPLPFLEKNGKASNGDAKPVAKNEPSPTTKLMAPAANPVPTVTTTGPTAEKPRFDFYKILPGGEEQIHERQIKQIVPPSPAASQKDAYFLQIGSYQNVVDADNQKAKLALVGVEAFVQTAEIPNRGLWYRVRVGPYTDPDDITKMRTTLAQSGIGSSVIKVKFGPQ